MPTQQNSCPPNAQSQSHGRYISRRIHNFGVTLLVMAVSFLLYYLGLFGGVEGPLRPENMGRGLADMGITRHHILGFFLAITLAATSWNWIFNFVCHALGARLTCKKEYPEGRICGASVRREKHVDKKSGGAVNHFICEHGHRLREAHFHPVRKGTLSHSLWVTAAIFSAIVILF